MSQKVTIEDRNDDGRGRGSAGDRIALVSQAHPGEVVTLRPDRHTRNTVQGRVGTILTADPRRIEHECQHEFACTGCPLLAAHPEDEAHFKVERVRQALEQAGLEASALAESAGVLQPLLTPGGPFHYRHYAKQVFTTRRNKVVLGSYVAATHRVVDNTGCPVLVPALAELLADIARRVDHLRLPIHREGRGGSPKGPDEDRSRPGLRYAIARHSAATGRALVVLVTSLAISRKDPGLRQDLRKLVEGLARRRGVAGVELRLNADSGNALLAGETVLREGEGFVEEELLGFRHRIGPDSFFQINPPAAEVLMRRAAEEAGEGRLCLEAFAGVGALTLPLAKRFRRVWAVENGMESVEALREAVRRAGMKEGRGAPGTSGVEAILGRAESVLPRRLGEGLAEGRPESRGGTLPDAIVLDPPRKGLGTAITEALANLAARTGERRPRIVLLSCDPSTLAHDLPPLRAAGYQVRRVTPVDQFPRTGHVETVTLLV